MDFLELSQDTQLLCSRSVSFREEIGYLTFDPEIQLAGVILNQVGSDQRHLELLTDALLHFPHTPHSNSVLLVMNKS